MPTSPAGRYTFRTTLDSFMPLARGTRLGPYQIGTLQFYTFSAEMIEWEGSSHAALSFIPFGPHRVTGHHAP